MVSAWSIGTGKRGGYKSSSDQAPGPGTYNQDKMQKMIPPKWKFTQSNRGKLVLNDAPGPGQYNQKSSIDGLKYSIGSGSKPKVESFLFVPGPGAYNPNKSSYMSPPHYSMGMKHTGVDKTFQPGPGAYNHKSSVINQPSSKFGTSVRNELSKVGNVPGVGNYAVTRPQSAGPKYGFGTSQRSGLYGSLQTPGPGQYDQKSAIDLSKGVTMISRRSNGLANETAKVPGPGAYNPSAKDKHANPSYKIGTETRAGLDRESLKTPGPGSYNPRPDANRPSSPQIKVGTDQRKPLNGMYNVPGPGQYNVRPDTADGPKLSFKGVNKADPVERERQKIPGPGTYMPSDNLVKERPGSAKIGTGLRPEMYKSKDAPGPGNYYLHKLDNGPKWGFGSGQRSGGRNQDDPGPGAYNLPTFFDDLPKFMMHNNPKMNYP